jgi:Protein of unknown function (DUF4245)
VVAAADYRWMRPAPRRPERRARARVECDDEGVSSDRDPVPPSKPARSALTVRDMAVAIGVLVVIILVLAGTAGSCSFSPGGPTVDDSRLPVVDAPAELAAIARTTPFPVRVPAVPSGWRSNSVDQDRVPAPTGPPDAANRSVRVGYLTPQDRYLRLVQTDAAEDALLATEAGKQPALGSGAQDIAGLHWVVYTRDAGEPIWIATVPGDTPTRALITGSGSADDFAALANAMATGAPA